MNFLKNINMLGMLLLFVSFLFGIKLPDWDFKLKLRHRSIITHSPFITLVLIAIYKVKSDYFFKYFIVGFSIAMAIHILFDLFPYKWKGGALLKIPINITCSEEISKIFFVMTVIVSSFMGIFYMTDIYEYFFVILLSTIIFIKKRKYERTFIKPLILFIFLMYGLGVLKFEFLMNLTVKLLNNII